jgi:hypothetical protein
VARDAQVQKLPRLGGFDRGAVRAELRGNREVERELRDDRGFLARGIADDVENFSEILNAELHGVISIVVVSAKHGCARTLRQEWASARGAV